MFPGAPRWHEYDSDDSDHEPDRIVPTFGPAYSHEFEEPIVTRGITLSTVAEFLANIDTVYFEFLTLNPGFEAMWAGYVEDIHPDSDPMDIDAAARDLNRFLCDDTIFTDEPMSHLAEQTRAEAELNPDDEPTLMVTVTSEQSAVIAEFNLSDVAHDPHRHTVEYPHIKPSDLTFDHERLTTRGPPLRPVVPDGLPVILRLCKSDDKSPKILEGREPWDYEIARWLGETAPVAISQLEYAASGTWATSMSNQRDPRWPQVQFVWSNGQVVNVGMHGYKIRHDVDIALSFTSVDLALQELFTAPGGEGLGTATPSHLLHQVVCAILSASVRDHQCLVEYRSQDIAILNVPMPGWISENVVIDITSSASLHHKKLRPRDPRGMILHQAAVTKYDVASVLMSVCAPKVSDMLAKLVCCCLACEFPEFWFAGDDSVTPDLTLQYQIYDTLASFGQKPMMRLSQMCYEAAILESIDIARINGHNVQGRPFHEKKQVLIDRLDSLTPRSNIAFPPLPLTPICAFPGDESALIDICGHMFDIPMRLPNTENSGIRYNMGNRECCDMFLESFPAVGIISFPDAKEISSIIDSTPLTVSGLTHYGPVTHCAVSEPLILQQTNEIYGSSANAQFLEIRADVVRAINRLPSNPAGIWTQAWIYKDKVCIWFRHRDPVVSAEGYRVDWFAVSAFNVAGSMPIITSNNHQLYLWPRQRIRSQEMDLIHMAPRRFKAVLFSMIEKAKAAHASLSEIRLAWERMLITTNTATWASGQTFLTARYLSASLASPSSPFDTMADKFVAPITFADVFYQARMRRVLSDWHDRSQYHNRSPILGLPRHMSQIESYWKEWVPNQFADTDRHMADCVKDLYSEHQLLESTREVRVSDLRAQLILLNADMITVPMLQESIRTSCSIDTDGKFGWSFVGSLAAAYALNIRSKVSIWDRDHARGRIARRLVDHMTVRHSARIDSQGTMLRGTVAEMIIDQGFDDYVSKVDQTYRFLFVNRPIFMNHPKRGEHKDREISITDPDSRIMLSDAELMAGTYGATTGIDYLKISDKDARFYQKAERILERGGVAQSSDAKRYGPMMSNMAIAIMCLGLGANSMHMKWSSLIYARLAFRKMLIPLSINCQLERQSLHDDTKDLATSTRHWIRGLPVCAHDESTQYAYYCDAHHMGQGMSHHGSSLLHAGGLLVAHAAADLAVIRIDKVQFRFAHNIMVTSDDSTTMPTPIPVDEEAFVKRHQKQSAGHLYLAIFRQCRKIALRSVSVTANLPKEVVAGDRVEFNSNDSGIGASCPILGFRELICLLVPPTSPSLIGDYLDAHANARTVAFAGQGTVAGSYFHALKIDAIEERWRITADVKSELMSMRIIPRQLITHADDQSLCSSPSSWLDLNVRSFLLQLSIDNNAAQEDIDPHVRDSVYGPLLHVRIAMAKQHRRAIETIKTRAETLRQSGNPLGAQMLDESLRATMSSARSRNLGRVATRIKYRIVKPRDYVINGEAIEFAKAPMFEATLAWLHYLDDLSWNYTVRADSTVQACQFAGYMSLSKPVLFKFPSPPRRRRFAKPRMPKPRYIDSTYGATPFGRHAIERASVIKITGDGHQERIEMQKYYAYRNYQAYVEHVTYGGAYVVNWHRRAAVQLVKFEVDNELVPNVSAPVRFGAFDDAAVNFLKSTQEAHPDVPVLALHRAIGDFGVFHALYRGRSIVVKREMELRVGSITSYMDAMNQQLILVVQGLDDVPTWNGSAPRPSDVDRYVNGGFNYPMSPVMQTLEDENVTRGRVTCPTYSTELMLDGVLTLVHTTPKVLNFHRQKSSYERNLGYFRSRVISELALAGYWFTSDRGVAFRAGLRGHWFNETTWTGATIGWHSSATNDPIYSVPHFQARGLREIFMINGLATGNELSQYDISIDASGYRLVSESSTRTYHQSFDVASSLAPLFVAANGGHRHHFMQENSARNVLTVPYVQPEKAASVTPDEARAQLIQAILGEDDLLIGF